MLFYKRFPCCFEKANENAFSFFSCNKLFPILGTEIINKRAPEKHIRNQFFLENFTTGQFLTQNFFIVLGFEVNKYHFITIWFKTHMCQISSKNFTSCHFLSSTFHKLSAFAENFYIGSHFGLLFQDLSQLEKKTLQRVSFWMHIFTACLVFAECFSKTQILAHFTPWKQQNSFSWCFCERHHFEVKCFACVNTWFKNLTKSQNLKKKYNLSDLELKALHRVKLWNKKFCKVSVFAVEVLHGVASFYQNVWGTCHLLI